jgi:hypothetical protein
MPKSLCILTVNSPTEPSPIQKSQKDLDLLLRLGDPSGARWGRDPEPIGEIEREISKDQV